MDIGRFYSCTKCLMFTFNIFLWFLGTGVLTFGIWSRFELWQSPVNKVISTIAGVYMTDYMYIFIGCITVILGSCGCCGAVMHNKLFLTGVKASIDGLLQDYVRKINNPQHDKITIDRLQKTMNCCFIHHVGNYSSCTLDNLNKSCADQMFIVTSQRHRVIADVAIGCGLVMGLGMIISMLLLCVIREISTHPYTETSVLYVSQV
ncbi:CD9 antigen-like isoform X2 [Haliotis rufescens]|uniref:CD9 antigen-like isoform X2 n=1 Tax=Haliotis rufescens TaxID=6454 RepID=UPI00201F8FC8|nr:CD9 antigen-like isoform X2 [Haliotis rufescens]